MNGSFRFLRNFYFRKKKKNIGLQEDVEQKWARVHKVIFFFSRKPSLEKVFNGDDIDTS